MAVRNQEFGITISRDRDGVYDVRDFIKQLEELGIIKVIDTHEEKTPLSSIITIRGNSQLPLCELRCGKCGKVGLIKEYGFSPVVGFDNVFCYGCYTV